MEKQYHEVAARAVLAYLYDHDMYSLAEQFCMANPYLRADQGALERGVMPVSSLHKPLRDVLKEFIVMQSQLLQLVNLCSSVIEFPIASSVLVLADHLIQVLKTSGTAEVLKTVVSTIPVCTDWSVEHSPTATTSDHSHTVGDNSTGSLQTLQEQSYSAGNTLLEQDIIISASDMHLIETLTACVESDSSLPILVDNAVFSGPSSAVKSYGLNGVLTVENVSYSDVKQSTVQQATTASVNTSPRNNQLNKQPLGTGQQQVREPITSNKPAPNAGDNVPKESTVKLPSTAAVITIDKLTNGTTRSNETPLDNPIVPGTVSSRSTSSRKRSHIRILDFGTPPFKRGSPSTVGRPSPVIPSPALVNVPKRAIPLEKQHLASSINQGNTHQPVQPAPPPPPAVQNDEPKPKKVINKRRIVRCGVRRQGKRIIGTKLYTKRLVPRMMPKSVPPPSTIPPQPTSDTNQPINLSKRADPPSTHKHHPSSAILSTAKKHPLALQAPSASPPRSNVLGSPACPIDPLALCPMTPRFLTRPLQPLCMLSPLLGTLDLSCVSQAKSHSHSKPTTDISTPGYPITPGNTITPSPPPTDTFSYYDSEATNGPRTTDPPNNSASMDDEAYDSESDQHHRCGTHGSPGVPKPLLTLTANSEEIVIRYDEDDCSPLRVRDAKEEGREQAAHLAARIEIDDGNGKVFHIAVSPLMELYEHFP
ncbi:uncharacterized protein LOC126557390 [Anopheles maculipalpis]|uniref:uncharacterized protein LOC126557390 n=1 Tax=Anopheles maculipalpis TaxID=1496333 RepID=UPI0021591D5D|nr:uncharacterized protein LOC126557390 [Anopheles maculipalpis]